MQNCMVAKTTISTLHHGLAAVSNSETCAIVVSRYIMSKLNMLMYNEIEGPGIRVVKPKTREFKKLVSN